MATDQMDRPHFHEQQYLGAADLEAVVEHGRLARARHDLGAHSWGIASGLQLLERTVGGSVAVYVQPGYGWDGFGRPLVVLEPLEVSAGLFAAIPFIPGLDDQTPPGHLVDVWLRFTATPRGAPSPGFESCSVDEQFARIVESAQVVIGERPSHAEQHEPVTVGPYTDDAAQVVKKLGAPTDPALVDESIAFQTFPEEWDRARWLVPVGLVRWVPAQDPFTPGRFEARTPADLEASDRRRRFIGVVTETVDAARGFIRMRSRAAAQYAPNVISDDLVWVEGRLRVEGDARLLGGQLVLRDAANGDAGRPLAVRRRAANTMVPQGSDLFLQIGSAEQGANRLVVGPVLGAPPAEELKERLVVKDDGKVGIGSPNPTAAPLVVRGSGATEDLLAFESAAGAVTFRISQLAGGKPGLGVTDVAANLDGLLFIQPGGNVGIGTTDPRHRLEVHGEDAALVVASDATSGLARNAGLELRTRAGDGVSYIDFARGSTDLAGSGTPDFSGRLSFNEANTGAFSLRGARVGVETVTPTNQLHVNHNSGLRVNRIYLSGGLGPNNEGWSSLAFNAHHNDANDNWVFPDPSRKAVTIEMDDVNGTPRFEVWSTTAANTQGWLRRLHVNGESGNVAINEGGGSLAVGHAAPACRLHVAGSANAAATTVGAHVALIDNVNAGTDADVLALRVGAGVAGTSNNFVTFFAGPTPAGAIEGNGAGGVSYRTSGADYAEWLPRADDEPPMQPGDVAGVHGGRLRRATEGADQIVVISTAPAVLANTPPPEMVAGHERIAMIGQTPVRVRGRVRAGDLIVASGEGDGLARAVDPARAMLADHVRAIGVAWESSPGHVGSPTRVRVGVGLPLLHLGASLHAALDALREEVRALRDAGSARADDSDRPPAPPPSRRPRGKRARREG
jgi:hypothetical protein